MMVSDGERGRGVVAGNTHLGDTLMLSTVRALPPSEFCSNRVSLESRYGMCFASLVESLWRSVGV